MAEFTFFMDAQAFFGGGELPATDEDLHDLGIRRVDIPTAYGLDLGQRIPVRVDATATGLRAYARLLGLDDPVQLEELERVCAAAERREGGL